MSEKKNTLKHLTIFLLTCCEQTLGPDSAAVSSISPSHRKPAAMPKNNVSCGHGLKLRKGKDKDVETVKVN